VTSCSSLFFDVVVGDGAFRGFFPTKKKYHREAFFPPSSIDFSKYCVVYVFLLSLYSIFTLL